LDACVRWKTVRRQYRRRLKGQLSTAHLVRETAGNIAQAFERFKRERKIASSPLSEDVLHGIIQAGLEVRTGGNPRHTIACELFATLPWRNIQGQAIKLTPSLVASTLETLRKYDIG
jgi:hypothetical protein